MTITDIIRSGEASGPAFVGAAPRTSFPRFSGKAAAEGAQDPFGLRAFYVATLRFIYVSSLTACAGGSFEDDPRAVGVIHADTV